MALDFHIAKSEKEAPMNYGGASFDETIHEIIFHRKGLPEGSFVYFRRIKDYYRDAKYMGDEIQRLLAEIMDLEKYFIGDNGIIKQLNEIKRMCSKAIDKNMNIWVYCD
jgi:hypothetical protein